MRFWEPTKTEWFVLAVICVVLAALLVPPSVGVWDGRFPLTIVIHEDEPIDRESLMFATCWFEREAEHALAHPGNDETGFRPLGFTSDGQAVIDVPASGRVGGCGTVDTYNHPEHLVVQYRLAASDNAPLQRKRFDIPKGRGPRSLSIDLP